MAQQILRRLIGPAGQASHLVLPRRFGKVAELQTVPGMALPHVALPHPESFWELIKSGMPGPNMPKEVFDYRWWNAPRLIKSAQKIAIARMLGIPHFYGSVYGVVFRGDRVLDYGLLSLKLVTNAGVAFLVDGLQNLTEPDLFKFHGYGTGTTAEAVGDTALVTELTTQYVTDNVRPTGSQTENAANIYETVATLSPDSGGTIAITEHGIFSATAAGTILDRSVFAAINLVAGSDSLQTTYRFTITAGG